jgi:hypothetical protein
MSNPPPSANRHERVLHHVKRIHEAHKRLRESHAEAAAHEEATRAQLLEQIKPPEAAP